MSDPVDSLNRRQRELLANWIPDACAIADHSWGLVDTVVLELTSARGHFILKAAGPGDHHIERELRAHREWLKPWVALGRAPRLIAGDGAAKLLVTEYLPGRLLEGTEAQDDPGAFRQAGQLLAQFHHQVSVYDSEWDTRFRQRILQHLDRPHRIGTELEQLIRAEVSAWPSGGSTVVPTHGDWQPRNWLINDGVVRVIDFGRASLRPATEDFVRLAAQDFVRDPSLESAFLDGYGIDPREPDRWRRALVGEAVGTAVWAYDVGDASFERFGLERLSDLYP